MEVVQYIPGFVAGLDTHTLPDSAPDIDAVVSAEITRLPSALSAHAGGAVVAHVPTLVDVIHANADVDPHLDHAHDLISQGLAPGTVGQPLGWDAIPPTQLEDDGPAALHTLAGGGLTGIQDQAMSVHVVTQPDDHLAAAIVASVDDHPAVDIAAALAAHVGADPVVAAGAVVKLTRRTFTLANATQVGDLLTLAYHAVGERILVS